MAIAAVAGEVCDDLISKEKPLLECFPEVNFSSALNANDLQNGLRRIGIVLLAETANKRRSFYDIKLDN